LPLGGGSAKSDSAEGFQAIRTSTYHNKGRKRKKKGEEKRKTGKKHAEKSNVTDLLPPADVGYIDKDGYVSSATA